MSRPRPGGAGASGSGAITSGDVAAAGRVWLKVKPGRFGKRSAKIRRQLKRGKVKVKVFVTYAPRGGSSLTEAKQLNLVRK